MPLIIFIVTFTIIIRLKKDENGNYNIDFFNLFNINFPYIKIDLPFKVIYGKLILIFISLFFLTRYYFVLDYSVFFPTNLKMTVTFNNSNGVKKLMEEFGIASYDGLIIEQDTAFVTAFFKKIDDNIYSNTTFQNFFTDCVITENNTLTIDGVAEFKVTKIEGVQNYIIEVAKGELINKKINKNQAEQSISSEFVKTSSTNDKLNVNLLKPLSDIIMAPQFSQIILIKDKNGIHKIPQENLIGMTKVTIFPYPNFSNTLYLVKDKNRLIPIGYAVYH